VDKRGRFTISKNKGKHLLLLAIKVKKRYKRGHKMKRLIANAK